MITRIMRPRGNTSSLKDTLSKNEVDFKKRRCHKAKKFLQSCFVTLEPLLPSTGVNKLFPSPTASLIVGMISCIQYTRTVQIVKSARF